MTHDHEYKTLDAITESAFAAGVAFAEGDLDGWPGQATAPSSREAYRAWRDRWAGVPHEDPGEATENAVCALTGGQHSPACWEPRVGHAWVERQPQTGGLLGDIAWEERVQAKPEIVFDLLCLVRSEIPGVLPTTADIRGWTNAQRLKVATWAAAIHLAASDHDDLEIPPVPAIIRGDGRG